MAIPRATRKTKQEARDRWPVYLVPASKDPRGSDRCLGIVHRLVIGSQLRLWDEPDIGARCSSVAHDSRHTVLAMALVLANDYCVRSSAVEKTSREIRCQA